MANQEPVYLKVTVFKPNYTITPAIASALMRIEAMRKEIELLPITPGVLAGLRATSRIAATHYSTRIEGNRLTQEEVAEVVEHAKKFKGHERDEKEVLGYYKALEYIEHVAAQPSPLVQSTIQFVHALVMGGGQKTVKPTAYRQGQNVIRDSATGKIVYLPPEASDVPLLMQELVNWISTTGQDQLPCPLRAAIAHYQFATIHPYYDGNGRTARLLTTFILHHCGYGLKGLYSLEEYYAQDLGAYYEALSIGPSHNYYLGRAEADITPWIDYFCSGMVVSFENIQRHALKASHSGFTDKSSLLRTLSSRKRQALKLFEKQATITSKDLEHFFQLNPRTARALCLQWVHDTFLVVANAAKKTRSYRLAPQLENLILS